MIRLENVSKTYKNGNCEVNALCNINLHITAGEFCALVGESGSGKSTLMNIVGCLDSPSNGNVFIDGKCINNFSSDEKAALRSREIGFIFQSFYLQDYLTAEENVMLPMIFAKTNEISRTERSKCLLSSVGIENRANHFPSQLSGGQRQRVCIARALANNPKIILADEPCGNLDSKTADDVMKLLKSLTKQNITVMMVTHNKNHIKYADTVYTVTDGKLK